MYVCSGHSQKGCEVRGEQRSLLAWLGPEFDVPRTRVGQRPWAIEFWSLRDLSSRFS